MSKCKAVMDSRKITEIKVKKTSDTQAKDGTACQKTESK